MALCRHAPQQGLLTGDLLAQQEEGGRDAPGTQLIQQPGGGVPVGAVIEGEGHIFFHLQRDRLPRRPGRRGGEQKGNSHSPQKDCGCAESISFHNNTAFSAVCVL